MSDSFSVLPSDRSAETGAERALLATASHEIRTPLNGILGTVSLLLETDLQPSQREYVEAIQSSGRRLLDMLNNVLDYARLDAGDIALEETEFSPTELAREVVELLAPQAHEIGIDIAVRTLSSEDGYAFGDAGRIRQILFNLIGNALKFTSKGGVLVDVTARPGTVIWSVIDSGDGISFEDQRTLFEAFHQTDASDARKEGGVGLGLAIVKRLTEILGGKVTVDSTPGFGSTFRLIVPMETRLTEIANSAPPVARVTLIGLPAPTALSIAKVLEQAGTQVHAASRTPRLRNPGVILMGADLPSAETARLAMLAPAIVVLRPEDRPAITRFRLLGCAGWLVRPLRPASLIERITLAEAGNRNLGDATPENRVSNARVLIADDNAVNTLIARRALEKSGFTVTVAASGVEAVEAAENMTYALILMDLRMPVMDGFEAMRRLRAEGHTTPIIAVSAEINPEIEARARECGANAVASKPLDAKALRALAETWAAQSETRHKA